MALLTYKQLLEARAQLKTAEEELDKITSKAELEHRDLSRREAARVNQISLRANALGDKIDAYRPSGRTGDFDPRGAQGERTLGDDHGRGRGDMLGPEQRMSDWVEERHGGGLFAGDAENDFSLGSCIRAMATGDRRSLTDLERRSLSEGVDANGGFLLAPQLASQVIDRARNRAAVLAAGATTIPMETETLYLARLTGASGAGWKAENDPVSGSDQTFDRLTFTARTCVVMQKLSVELFEDLSPEANQVIEGEIIQALGLAIDYAALRGSGVAPIPLGIRNQANVNIVSLGANGAQLAGYDNLSDAIGKIRDANGEPNAAIMASRTATFLSKLKDSTGQSLRQPAPVAGLQFFTSNQIPVNVTQGSSNDTSELYVADWSKVLIGVRPTLGVRMQILKERFVDNLQYGIVAWLRADVQLAQPTHCSVITGIKP